MIYCENIVNVALFFFTPPQISEPHFFPPMFGNGIATIVTKIFFSYFGNGIATISLSQFFFLFTLGTQRTLHNQSAGIEQRNFGTLSKFNIFSLPRFSSSLSYFLMNFGNGDTEIHSFSSKS